MTAWAAIQEAIRRWGARATVWHNGVDVLPYHVGLAGFPPLTLGSGTSWEAAFADSERAKGMSDDWRTMIGEQDWDCGETDMHYKNGREAKNGDKVVLIPEHYGTPTIGILYDATPGNDACNGKLASISGSDPCPNLRECLHMDDVKAALDRIP
jgi:hypothetical protein